MGPLAPSWEDHIEGIAECKKNLAGSHGGNTVYDCQISWLGPTVDMSRKKNMVYCTHLCMCGRYPSLYCRCGLSHIHLISEGYLSTVASCCEKQNEFWRQWHAEQGGATESASKCQPQMMSSPQISLRLIDALIHPLRLVVLDLRVRLRSNLHRTYLVFVLRGDLMPLQLLVIRR